jgi:hypothetical protein
MPSHRKGCDAAWEGDMPCSCGVDSNDGHYSGCPGGNTCDCYGKADVEIGSLSNERMFGHSKNCGSFYDQDCDCGADSGRHAPDCPQIWTSDGPCTCGVSQSS